MLRLIALCLLLSSCYVYQVFPREDRDYQYKGLKLTAYVENPSLKKEYTILDGSGLFQLTRDSNNASVRIRLDTMVRRLSCGEPILGSVITLGQLPVYFPDVYFYRFREIRGTDTLDRKIDL